MRNNEYEPHESVYQSQMTESVFSTSTSSSANEWQWHWGWSFPTRVNKRSATVFRLSNTSVSSFPSDQQSHSSFLAQEKIMKNIKGQKRSRVSILVFIILALLIIVATAVTLSLLNFNHKHASTSSFASGASTSVSQCSPGF